MTIRCSDAPSASGRVRSKENLSATTSLCIKRPVATLPFFFPVVRIKYRLFWFALSECLLCLLLAGCNRSVCYESSDCGDGEVCVLGECVSELLDTGDGVVSTTGSGTSESDRPGEGTDAEGKDSADTGSGATDRATATETDTGSDTMDSDSGGSGGGTWTGDPEESDTGDVVSSGGDTGSETVTRQDVSDDDGTGGTESATDSVPEAPGDSDADTGPAVPPGDSDSARDTSSQPGGGSDSGIDGDTGDPCAVAPCINDVAVAGRSGLEVAEGHAAAVVIDGVNLSMADRVTVGDEMTCEVDSVSDQRLRCTLDVPHGAALGAPDNQPRRLPVILWVGEDSVSDDAAFLDITPIVVSTDGDDGGPGTLSSPYRTVSRALSRSDGADTVVVFGGAYGEEEIFPLTVPPGVTVRGVADVEIVSPSPTTDILHSGSGGTPEVPTRLENLSLSGGDNGWTINGGHVEIVDTTLSGEGRYGLHVETTAVLHLEGVTLNGFGAVPDGTGATGALFATHSAEVWARDINIAQPARGGWGIYSSSDGEVVVDGAFISNRKSPDRTEDIYIYTTGGVRADNRARLTLTDVDISYCDYGIFALNGASLYATNVDVSSNLDMGLWLINDYDDYQGEAILDNVSVVKNGGHGINLFRKNLYMKDSLLALNGFDGIIVAQCPEDSWPLLPDGPAEISVVDTRIEWNGYRGIWIGDCDTPLYLERVSFLDNLDDDYWETDAQLFLAASYFGAVTANSVSFAFSSEGPVYEPPSGTTATGGDWYRDPDTGELHYTVEHPEATIVFSD